MDTIETLAVEKGQFELRPGLRGVSAENEPASSAAVQTKHWRPAGGQMSLPLLTLELDAYEENKKAMLSICRDFRCQIAPHAKTPMSPVLAQDLVSSGAWGVSVADLRQAEVMLHHGLLKVLIANEIGGKSAVSRLTKLLRVYPDAEVFMFVDSLEVVSFLVDAWSCDATLPQLNLLVEVGCGRGGLNSNMEVAPLVGAIAGCNSDRIRLAGIAAYEGTAIRSDEKELRANLDDLFERVALALKAARQAVGQDTALILSVGGSSIFDYVITRCRPMVDDDANATLLLRSGACFFSDHGPIQARLQAIAEREMLGKTASSRIANSFRPALRIWAEVLSTNGPHDAICGFGLRDVAHDQGLPVPLAVWRDARRLTALGNASIVSKLNDQHAFVHVTELEVVVGDVIEFGVKHPCTTIDKHDVIFGLDEQGEVKVVLRTFFG
jgi:D-serine dehydratase